MSGIFSVLLLGCILLFAIAYKDKYSRLTGSCIVIIIVFLLSIMGACIEPDSRYDLFRHYEVINRVRASSYNLKEFLSDGYTITDYNYKYTYAYNILIYIIARFLPNQALPFFVIFVSYGIFAYIAISELYDGNLTNRNVILSFSILSILMPYLYVYSNIRNPMASAIISLGLYCYFKKHRIHTLLICGIIALLIHPISVAIVPFIIFRRINPGIKGILVTVLLPSITFRIMEVFRSGGGNEFLFRIAAKYYNYTMVRMDNQGKVFLLSTVLVLLVIVLLSIIKNKEFGTQTEGSMYDLTNVIVWYTMFSLGYFQNYEMMTRLPYSIAFLSPVLVRSLLPQSNDGLGYRKVAIFMSEMMIYSLAILGIYENFAWLH